MGTKQLRPTDTRIIWLSTILFALLFASGSSVADKTPLKVKTTDTYINMHTGPGRGHPVFHVLEKAEVVTLLKSKTDWIKVRTKKGKEGWMSRRDMQYTVGVNGEFVDLGIPNREDYIQRRWEVGFSLGEFKNVEVLGIHANYRFANNLSIEARLSQSTGSFSNSQFASLGFINQPFPNWKVSPYFTLAAGKIQTNPNATIVQTEDRNDNYLLMGAGAYYYFTHRILLRFEYNNYTILPSRDENENIDEWRLGISTFF